MPTRMEDLQAAARAAGATEEDITGDPNAEEVVEDDDQELEAEVEGNQPDEGESSEVPDEGAELPEDGDDPYNGLPETFFGEDIHAYADENGVEAAEVFFNALQDANRVANSRLQQIAELKKQAEAEAAEEVQPLPTVDETGPTEPLSDEELLVQFGYDPGILNYEELGKPVVDMLRRQLDIESRFEAQQQESQAQAWERQYWGKVDELQAEHGELPYDRETLEIMATERRIFDPTALYWSVIGPIKAAAKPAATKPKGDDSLKNLKRTVGKGARKRSTSPSKTTTITKGMTLAESLAAAKKELGKEDADFSF